MTSHFFLRGEVSAFLIENGKEPKWLEALFVSEIDIASRKITVCGLLPNNLHLAKFQNGVRIEFHHSPFGPKNRYGNGTLFMSLNNCRLENCWIPEPIPQDTDLKLETLEIWAVIEGDIEVVNENS